MSNYLSTTSFKCQTSENTPFSRFHRAGTAGQKHPLNVKNSLDFGQVPSQIGWDELSPACYTCTSIKAPITNGTLGVLIDFSLNQYTFIPLLKWNKYAFPFPWATCLRQTERSLGEVVSPLYYFFTASNKSLFYLRLLEVSQKNDHNSMQST